MEKAWNLASRLMTALYEVGEEKLSADLQAGLRHGSISEIGRAVALESPVTEVRDPNVMVLVNRLQKCLGGIS